MWRISRGVLGKHARFLAASTRQEATGALDLKVPTRALLLLAIGRRDRVKDMGLRLRRTRPNAMPH